MLHFLSANSVTIVVLTVLAFIVFLAIRKIIKDKKENIAPCGQKCSSCPHGAQCRHI